LLLDLDLNVLTCVKQEAPLSQRNRASLRVGHNLVSRYIAPTGTENNIYWLKPTHTHYSSYTAITSSRKH